MSKSYWAAFAVALFCTLLAGCGSAPRSDGSAQIDQDGETQLASKSGQPEAASGGGQRSDEEQAGDSSDKATPEKAKPEKDAAEKDAPEKGAAEKVMPVTALVLSEAFAKHPEEAKSEYLKKRVWVSGAVDMVDVFTKEAVVIMLSGWKNPEAEFGFPLNVRVRIEKPLNLDPRVRTLHHTQQITVEGTCLGFNGLVVDVWDSKVVSIGPDPELELTAEQLAKAYVDDADAAAKKYEDHWMKLTGVIAAMEDNGLTVRLQEFKTPDGSNVTVKCTVGGLGRDYIEQEKLAPGDTILLKGECGFMLDDEIYVSQCVIMGRAGNE